MDSYQYGLLNLVSTLGFNPTLLHLFCCLPFPALAIGSSFRWLCPSDTSPSLRCCCFSEHFLFGAIRRSRLILFIFYPSPKISHLSKFQFLLLENNIRNQDLGARYAHCYWGVIASRSSQVTEQGSTNVCTLTHVYTHIYKYFYI